MTVLTACPYRVPKPQCFPDGEGQNRYHGQGAVTDTCYRSPCQPPTWQADVLLALCGLEQPSSASSSCHGTCCAWHGAPWSQQTGLPHPHELSIPSLPGELPRSSPSPALGYTHHQNKDGLFPLPRAARHLGWFTNAHLWS